MILQLIFIVNWLYGPLHKWPIIPFNLLSYLLLTQSIILWNPLLFPIYCTIDCANCRDTCPECRLHDCHIPHCLFYITGLFLRKSTLFSPVFQCLLWVWVFSNIERRDIRFVPSLISIQMLMHVCFLIRSLLSHESSTLAAIPDRTKACSFGFPVETPLKLAWSFYFSST